MDRLLLIVNFGGPRHLTEIHPFLQELLTDEDVIRTKMPRALQKYLFTRIAKNRSKTIVKDYELIGGKSPIFEDTEKIASNLAEKLNCQVLTFHRYLPSTHPIFKKEIEKYSCNEILVFPLFPQFSYSTTGSIARWFFVHLPASIVQKMRWISSYASHPLYIKSFQKVIQEFLASNHLKEEETAFLFSAHGLPQDFIDEGDIYETECNLSFKNLSELFPKALSRLCYQSKFGKGEWLKPYTNDVCNEALSWVNTKKNVVVVPLSFTTDHIETLFEIEHQYLPLIEKQGLRAYRCPALNHHPFWMDSIVEILKTSSLAQTEKLIRS